MGENLPIQGRPESETAMQAVNQPVRQNLSMHMPALAVGNRIALFAFDDRDDRLALPSLPIQTLKSRYIIPNVVFSITHATNRGNV